MPLPKIATPTYDLELPSSGESIQYRPFLVKEEKVLVIALESEDTKQITTAIKSVIKNCILTKGIKVEALPTFDIEYLLLKITGKYVFMSHIYVYSTYQVEAFIYKNGSRYKRFSGPLGSGGNDNPNGQKIVDLVHLDEGEYVEVWARQARSGDSNTISIYGGNEKETSFVGYLI